MNDLERDLKDLFESKAGGMQTTPLAPPAVLRRGRRRQVGTVVGGALVAIAAAAVVVAGASVFLADHGEAPPMVDPDVLPERTATIAGITVTTPDGWSLLDQSALGFAVPTQMCSGTGSVSVAPDGSFSATGTPIGEGEPAAVPSATEECTPLDVPEGGIPMFTMGNSEPHPLQTMCEVAPEIETQTVAGDDAFLSVSMGGPAEGTVGHAWPVSLEPEDGPCGAGLYARWSADGTAYLGVARFGPDATDADREAVIGVFQDMRFSTPTDAVPLVLGYLLDGGEVAGVPWRVVAGPNLLCEAKDACGVSVAAVSGNATGSEPQMPVSPPRAGTPMIAAAEPLGEGIMIYGTADPTVRSIEIVSSNGTRTVPASVRWPETLQGFVNADVIEGSVWWAVVDDVERVEAVLEDGNTFTTLPGEEGEATLTP